MDLPRDLPQDLPQSEQTLLLSPPPLPRMLPPSSPGAAGPRTATVLEAMTALFLMRLVVLHADKVLAVLLFCIVVAVRKGGGGTGAGCSAMSGRGGAEGLFSNAPMNAGPPKGEFPALPRFSFPMRSGVSSVPPTLSLMGQLPRVQLSLPPTFLMSSTMDV